MVATNLEELVPGLADLRAEERQTRALAFAGLTNTLCGVEVLCLTPRHRLGLQLLRNAFTVAHAVPLAGDVYQFLWHLSPDWRLPLWRRSFARDFKQWRLRRHVGRLDLTAATRAIHRFLVVQMQDAGESDGATTTEDRAQSIHWIADDASFWVNVHGGFTLHTYLDTPYIVLQQLARAWRSNHPTVTHGANGVVTVDEPTFINRSDRIVHIWHQGFRAAAVAVILNQRERKQ